MEILYIQYSKGNQTKYLLLLYLGQRGNKLCGLITQSVDNSDKDKVIANKAGLLALPLDKRVEWLRHNCPMAYRKAYREIYQTNIKILDKYLIN